MKTKKEKEIKAQKKNEKKINAQLPRNKKMVDYQNEKHERRTAAADGERRTADGGCGVWGEKAAHDGAHGHLYMGTPCCQRSVLVGGCAWRVGVWVGGTLIGGRWSRWGCVGGVVGVGGR